MKKLLTLFALCLMAVAVQAAVIEFDATTDVGTGSSTAGEFTIEKNGITVHVEQGVANGQHYRFYKNKMVTVTSIIGDITGIEFTCIADDDAHYGPGGFSVNTGDYSYSGIISTWVGQANPVVFSAVLQVRATKITVTVGGEIGLLAPSITPRNGTYYAPVEVKMSCATPGAVIYYTTNGSDPTTSSTEYSTPFTIPFELGNVVTVKAISEKDGEVSDVVSTSYMFEERPAFGWADMFNTADNANVTFTYPSIVLWQSGINMYVKDDTGYGLVYQSTGQTYQIGDIIPAGFSGVKTTYNNHPELQSPKDFQAATQFADLAPEIITPNQVDDAHWAHYVLLRNVTVAVDGNGGTFTDANGNSCTFYINTFNVAPPTDGGVHDVYGIVAAYRENFQILPISYDVTPAHTVIKEDYDFITEGIAYKITDLNTVKVTYIDYLSDDNYKGLNSAQVPEMVEFNGSVYQVNAIGEYAFWGCSSLTTLIVPPCISSIASNAFSCTSLEYLYIVGNGDWQGGAIPIGVNALYVGSGVTSIRGLQVSPNAIYSFAAVPPECNENTFLGYNAVLHVPAASFTDYFMADYWCNFADIRNDAVEPVSVSLNSYEAEMLIGNTMTISALVSPNNATPNTVIWTTSDPQVAAVNNGVVSAMGEGECDIVATCLDKRAVCHVTVVNPVSVTLDQTEVTIEQTQQVTLTATITPESANTQDIVWTTSDAAIATVDGGIVTAVGIGECDITVSYHDKQAVCHVTVIETMIYITLDKHEARLLPNHMITLTPTTSPFETSLKVTSSDPNVAVARLVNGVVQVAGRVEGTTMVIVGSVDGTAIPDTCLVTVYTENGDVNCDGYVNISDVTDLIDYLLSGNGDSVNQTNADCDKDSNVNIADVTTLIDYLLGGIDINPPMTEAFTVNGVTFNMVVVDGGTFTMGATPEQGSDANSNEYPTHQVTLSSYCIGETEVTQALWQAVMGINPSYFNGGNYCTNLQRPVEYVSWNDCQTFIIKLNELTGKTFRLPTEAEWEYAARGGNRSQGYKYAGSNDIDDVAWYYDNSFEITKPVATKAPNELGLYDMSGNVWEWCQDWSGSYSSEPQINPTGPASGSARKYRGGCWGNVASSCRVSYRNISGFPTVTSSGLGLRLAL